MRKEKAMKNLVFCIALVAVFALCLPSWSAPPIAKWSQPVDTTNPLGLISLVVVTPTPWDYRSADDWKCTDGVPITQIVWWGDYHKYEENNAGPVNSPTVLPISFILRQYKNNATDPANTNPGDLVTEVEIPIANCNQTYVTSVQIAAGPPAEYVHIFRYQATLATPWTQEKDSIYWLSVQAKYDQDPAFLIPPPYMNWEWLNTPPADFLGAGQISYDAGANWAKVEYGPGHPYAGNAYNFAFELSPLELTVTPATLTPNTQTTLKIVANIPPIARNFVVYIVVMLPDNQMMSFVPAAQARGRKGALDMNIPCLPVKGLTALARGTANTIPQGANVTIFNNNVSLAAGTYLLKIGLFDPQQPLRSENDAFLLISTEVVVE